MGQQHSPEKLARFLDYILGRRPDEFGLVPDSEGYVKIKDLLKVMHEEEGWGYVNQGALNEVVVSVPNAPVEISETRIRAVNRDLLPAPAFPENLPKLLYTAVRSKAHPVVVENGILPLGGLPYVVMSSDRAMARRIGRRIDSSPVLLTVQVAWAARSGVQIQQFGEKLYLAGSIPVGAFTAPPLPKETADLKPKKKAPEEIARAKTPGSFTLDLADLEEKATVRRERKKKEISREMERRHMRRQKHERAE